MAVLSKPPWLRKPPSSVVVTAASRNGEIAWSGTQSGVPGPETNSTLLAVLVVHLAVEGAAEADDVDLGRRLGDAAVVLEIPVDLHVVGVARVERESAAQRERAGHRHAARAWGRTPAGASRTSSDNRRWGRSRARRCARSPCRSRCAPKASNRMAPSSILPSSRRKSEPSSSAAPRRSPREIESAHRLFGERADARPKAETGPVAVERDARGVVRSA